MTRPAKILYVQHAGALGGSCMSLLYLLRALPKNRYAPVVALTSPSDAVERLYLDAGFQTIRWPGVACWNHTTAIQGPVQHALANLRTLRTAMTWSRSEKRTLELVDHVAPDLVHLNSVVLSPSARALARAGRRFVWHVREHPPAGHLSIRTALLSRMLRRYPSRVVFLSEADRVSWRAPGVVVYNSVDFHQFDRTRDGESFRARIGVPNDVPLVLFVGGLTRLKGALPLISALALAREELGVVHCVAPGSVVPSAPGRLLRVARHVLPLLGSGTVVQQCIERINELGLAPFFHMLPFERDIGGAIAACDVVVFPATAPHFARPVIEASAMAKPVIASRLTGLEELVLDGKTGLLVPPNEPEALARAIVSVLRDPEGSHRMGEAGYALARERFSSDINTSAILRVYDELLSR